MNPAESQSPDSLPLSREERADRVCDEFERQWKAGQQPRIEDYLERGKQDDRQDLLRELLALEWEFRADAGERFRPDEYRQRFPRDAAIVDAAWAELQRRRPDSSGTSTEDFVPDHDTPGAGVGKQPPANDTEEMPKRIGRYVIQRKLGRGGFGVVYLAHDPQLDRPVAIKAPRADKFDSEADLDEFVKEAKTAARMDHPGIVRVHDVQREPGSVYIVQQYIDGQDLRKHAKLVRPSARQIAEWMIGIADAVGYAHGRDFFHRDLKPENVLVDSSGQPHVADFGLALHVSVQRQHRGELAGTCAYMSPEQVRGEAHRLDGRSDIWSLGVILYELLTGRRPFAGAGLELLDEIEHRDPRPLREINREVDPELSRICLTCLAKRKTDRYETTADLIDDLRRWVKGIPSPPDRKDKQEASAPVKIVPKGLRSFDAGDADFFLELLPGPRDRDDLPSSIRSWKSRMEETDPEATFTVGVMYGPSGCGKSSLVKAGLLPRLSEEVLPVYVEATAADTEVRLLKSLRKRCPELPDDASLPEAFAQLRTNRGSRGRKVLVVLDQSEQWLHACGDYAESQLVRALRQCDGAGVQCLVLVRADFWMSVTRFMQALEVPLVEGHNSAAVDLFDPDHARKVLAAFGHAYGRLGDSLGNLTPQQLRFLDLAVEGLAQEGKVICVRLAVFADMMKGRPWTEASLREVGGAEGVGVTFLDESFTAKTAPPSHRQHEKAAREVLQSLLPEHGTDIKGQMQPYDRLLEASGYANRRADFDFLLGILNNETRLITPTDPDRTVEGDDGAATAPDKKYYQLTHDYLAPSLREWLTREQKKTRRGRAELRLAERAAMWNAKPENRHLPAWWEYLNIRLLTPKKNWTEAQGKMMRMTGRVHLIRATMALALLVVASIAAVKVRQGFVEQQHLTRAQGLVNGLVNAKIAKVPDIMKDLGEYAPWAKPLLTEKFAQAADGSPEKLHLSLALVGDDERHVEYLYEQLLTADPRAFPVIRNALAGYEDRLRQRLWTVLASRETDPNQRRLHAAAALAKYDSSNAQWKDVAPEVAAQLVTVEPLSMGQWQEALRDVADRLVPALIKIFTDPQQGELPRSLTTSLLADYAKDDAETLTNLLIAADAKAFTILFRVLERHKGTAIEKLQAVLERKLLPSWKDAPLEPSWPDPDATAGVAIEAAHGMLAERFAFCQDMPWEEFPHIAEKLRASGYRPTRVRSWSDGQKSRVAAIWARDGKRWELQPDVTKDQLPSAASPAEKDGLVAADVGVLPSGDATAERRFVLLWSEPTTAKEQRWLRVDLSESRLAEAHADLVKQGFASQSTIGVWTDAAGQRHYLGIWSNQGTPSELISAYPGSERIDKLQWDVAVAPAAKPADPLDTARQQLVQIARLPADQLEQPQWRLARAEAQYQLGQLEPALADLDFLIEKKLVTTRAHQYRAWTLARLGKAEKARAELAKYLEQKTDPSTQAYVQMVLAAWLGDRDDAAKQLDIAAALAGQNADELYNAACAAALASQACEKADGEQAKKLAARALELLTTAVTHGYKDAHHLRSDADLAGLHGDPRFTALLGKLEPPARYAALWHANPELESRLESFDARPEQQGGQTRRDRARQLAAEGFRPVAIATDSRPTSGPPTSEMRPHTSIVWHRPRTRVADQLRVGKHQASAAIALLRRGELESMFAALRVRDDPESLTQFVHGCRDRGVTTTQLLECLDRADALRQAAEGEFRKLEDRTVFGTLLALGEFDLAGIPEPRRQPLIDRLVNWYAADPSSAIHGATGWLLRHWGFEKEVAKVDHAPVPFDDSGKRDWFVVGLEAAASDQAGVGNPTTTIYFTFIVFPPREFVMGSPDTEGDRLATERLHGVKLTWPIAVSDRETTWAQFNPFDAGRFHDAWEKQFSKKLTLEEPAFGVNWFDAVRYCRWLTKQAGLSEADQCYDDSATLPKDGEGNPATWPVHLDRRGFRLPTESEWEYVCRCDTKTAFSFGNDQQLLRRYGWFLDNSEKWSHAVAQLRPNLRGMFDLHGNLLEWCHDGYGDYSEDPENPLGPAKASYRVGRGGGWDDFAGGCRAADRLRNVPSDRNGTVGFRVALVPAGGRGSREAEPGAEAEGAQRRSPPPRAGATGGADSK